MTAASAAPTPADDSVARAQVWEAVRHLSDAQRERLQQQLLSPLGTRVTLGGDNQADAGGDWRPSDVVHALLGHLHHVVHLQQTNSLSSPPPSVAKSDGSQRTPTSAGVTTPTATTTATATSFSLAKDDFPSLQSTASAAANGGAKTAKRRITTTLVSDQSAITRPVRTAVAFPTDAANPWAKRELLERRMMAALEPGSIISNNSSSNNKAPDFPTLSPPLSKTRTQPSSLVEATSLATPPRKLFDDSPPGGPKRVQPFPVHVSNQQQEQHAEPQSPVVTTPLKNSSPPQPPALLCVKPKRPRRQSLLASTPSGAESQLAPAHATPPGASASALVQPMKTAGDFSTNLQAAKLYAFLINNRLAGSTCAELQLLVGLLFRSTCGGAGSAEPSHDSDSAARCSTPSEFCWRSHCLQFAAAVFTELEPLLRNLETELLRLLLSSLADADICSGMVERLQSVAQLREELRVAESARIGCKLPVETRASAVRDFALPFCEEMDSRLHYRSPTESVMYANREKVRDGFLDLLRQFQKQQHSLAGIESAQVAASAVESATKLLAEVAPENRWWFAKFFVQELVQVGSNPFGESDKDLVLKIMEDKLVGKNPDRLRKLHRRFSSQKQSTNGPTGSAPASHSQQQQQAAPAGGHAGNGASKPNSNSSKSHVTSNSNKAGGSKAESSSARSPSLSAGSGEQVRATFEATREYFAENQQFFFHFLHSCDSYEFSQLVKHQLESQFQAIWKQRAAADPRKSFTDVVLRLKVVAKFLGYLRFSPHWPNSSSLVQLSKQNPAFQAAKKEAVWTLENAESVGLDVKLALEQSVADATISKCVPWLCDYLTMLSLDKLSLATTYFKQLLVLLARIYRSPRLAALGETGLYVSLQIERVFHVLDFDVASFLDDAQLQAPHLQPSERLLSVLHEVSPRTTSEDHLPFLYSQVFVQSCVSELEDLRGFIQTRAQPSHRVAKRSAGGANGAHPSSSSSTGASSSAIPRRKLRPLQVVTEDDHADDLARADAASESGTAAAAAAAVVSGLSDDDKLAESIFKIHPHLRKVVEFVVEVVATNICEHVLQQIVTPRADAFVQACAAESGLSLHERSPLAASAPELEAATLRFLQLAENRAARSIHESAGQSLSAAMQLSADKVRASIPHLLPPACHPTLAQSVALVALSRTRGVVRNLIPKSSRSEFLKRLAVRKKAVLKEAASASAKLAARAADSDDSVVRTLATMFDEHAGVDDGASHDELLAELKQTSAQVFKLGSAGRPSATPDEWAKLHASLSRYVRSFKTSLGGLLESGGGGNQEPTGCAAHVLHELPVWDTVWRVFSSCVGASAALAQSVARWEAATREFGSPHVAEGSARVLVKTVNGLTDQLVALLEMVARSAGDDAERRRRTSRLLRVVAAAAAQTLPDDERGNQEESSELADRLVRSPRRRILAAIAELASQAAREPAHGSDVATTAATTETKVSASVERTQRRLLL